MKLQRETVSPKHFVALVLQMATALQTVKFDLVEGTDIVAIDGDFQHTTNIKDARWLVSWTAKRAAVTRINSDGSMTNIITEWDNDPVYHVEDWQYEVANGDTRLSYADWVETQKEMEE